MVFSDEDSIVNQIDSISNVNILNLWIEKEMHFIWEAAKKVLFFSGPTTTTVGGKGPTTKEKITFFLKLYILPPFDKNYLLLFSALLLLFDDVSGW